MGGVSNGLVLQEEQQQQSFYLHNESLSINGQKSVDGVRGYYVTNMNVLLNTNSQEDVSHRPSILLWLDI